MKSIKGKGLFPFLTVALGQNESIYFPQEIVVIEGCETSENKSCSYNFLRKKKNKKVGLFKTKTLIHWFWFKVNSNSEINQDKKP